MRNVIRVNNCRRGIIKGLTLEHIGKSKKDIKFSGIDIDNSSVEISGCRIKDADGHGISLVNGSCSLVHDCTVESSGYMGAYVRDTGTSPTIRDNIFLGNTKYGVLFIKGGNGVVEKNVFEGNRDSGIVVMNGGANVTATANKCIENGRYGIYYGSGAKGKIENNTCEHNKCGMFVTGKKTNVLVRNNHFQERCAYLLLMIPKSLEHV